MKYFTLFLLLISSAICHSQTPFARPGAHWCIPIMYPTALVYNEGINARDTIVGGISCSMIDGYGCFYNQNDTIYRILQNGNSYFVYNYGAAPGDQWFIFAPESDFFNVGPYLNLRVDSVDSVSYNSYNLRRIYSSMPGQQYQQYGYFLPPIIEGVGSSYSFLPGPWGLYDLGIPVTVCYSDSSLGSVSVWDGELNHLDSCVCHVWMGDSKTPEITGGNLVYENGQIKISGIDPHVPTLFQLLDIQGKLILQQEIQTETGIAVGRFPGGIYFASLQAHGKAALVQKLRITH